MKKIITSIILTILISIMSESVIAAANCQNLLCVRNNIDRIDTQLINLIGERLIYVKQAGKIKKNKAAIHDSAREKRILIMVSNQAKKDGYSASIAKEIFKTILKQSNIYEKKLAN